MVYANVGLATLGGDETVGLGSTLVNVLDVTVGWIPSLEVVD